MFLLWYKHSSPGNPFIEVSGLTLLKRALLSAIGAGFSKIAVCLHEEDEERARAEIKGDRRLKAEITFLTEAVDPSTAIEDTWLGHEDEVAVALGDRVWTNQSIKELEPPLKSGIALLAIVDKAKKDGLAGLFRVRANMLGRPLVALTTARELSVSWVKNEGHVDFIWTENVSALVREKKDVAAAESVLLRSLKKPADGLVSRSINRRLSLFLSRRLARKNIHPNHVTAVVFGIGMCSGLFAFFLGGYWGFVLGSLCYYLSAILDGCDGEISRLKYLGSPLGAWLDTITDDLVCLSYIVGMYGRLILDSGGPFWLWTGAVGAVFYILTILPRYYVMAFRLRSGDFQKLAKQKRPLNARGIKRVFLGIRDIIFRTDFLPFYAFATAVAGFVPAFAIPFAAGSIASAVDTMATVANPPKSAE